LGRFPDLTVELARGKASEMNARLAARQISYRIRTFDAPGRLNE